MAEGYRHVLGSKANGGYVVMLTNTSLLFLTASVFLFGMASGALIFAAIAKKKYQVLEVFSSAVEHRNIVLTKQLRKGDKHSKDT